MKVRDLTAQYEAFCPQELALEGDPVGLQIGSLDADIHKVLVTLDVREQTVAEAVAAGCDMIFAKHPVIFRPLSGLSTADSQEAIVLSLARAGIAVYTSHTNIDVVAGGLNDWFCDLLGITETELLCADGLGRVGNVEAQSLSRLTERVKAAFGLDRLRVVSYAHDLTTREVRRVAICGGTGGRFWPEVLAKGADVYITGDIYYHSAHDLLSSGLVAIDPGHYIEHLFVPRVAEILRGYVTDGAEIVASQAATNPFYDI